jgi:phosphoglycolate phosphatase
LTAAIGRHESSFIIDVMIHDARQRSVTGNGFCWTEADAYMFDIDGTLLNTRDLVHWNALHQAMAQVYGLNTTIEGIAYHGKTDLGILRAALDRAGIPAPSLEKNLPQALSVISREVDRDADKIVAEVCPCIPDVLARLQNDGKLLGVASGNLKAVGWHKLKTAGLDHCFEFGCFSDEHEQRVDIFCQAVNAVRERLGPEVITCFIGDTPADVHAALQVNAKVIAVGTGTFAMSELVSHGPHLCIGSCEELLDGSTRAHLA